MLTEIDCWLAAAALAVCVWLVVVLRREFVLVVYLVAMGALGAINVEITHVMQHHDSYRDAAALLEREHLLDAAEHRRWLVVTVATALLSTYSWYHLLSWWRLWRARKAQQSKKDE